MHNWRKGVLRKYFKEILITCLFPIVFVLATIVANRFFGWSFSWQDISPIEQPQPFVRLVYSVLVYSTLGAVLFAMGFYWGLYQTIGRLFGYGFYVRVKTIIWAWMIGLMYLVIIPAFVNFLNFILSICFNTYQFFLESFPLLIISGTIVYGGAMIYLYVTQKEPFVLKGK